MTCDLTFNQTNEQKKSHSTKSDARPESSGMDSKQKLSYTSQPLTDKTIDLIILLKFKQQPEYTNYQEVKANFLKYCFWKISVHSGKIANQEAL